MRVRIAIIHSFYESSQPSGENSVVVDQFNALSNAGHEVCLIARYTDEEKFRRFYALRTGIAVATGHGPKPTPQLDTFSPDVVHIHNLFPNFGTTWLQECRLPIVSSVHNYRSVCSSGTLFRDGNICCACPNEGQIHAVRHKCYRDSWLATIPLAISRKSQGLGLLNRADAIVATSTFSRDVLNGLLPQSLKMHVVPNFGAPAAVNPTRAAERDGWVAMGRFTPEKGFVQLAKDWPEGEKLTLIGSGPEIAAIMAASKNKNIEILPSVQRDKMRHQIRNFRGLIMPSRWFEVAPQVVLEGLRLGLPVVAHVSNASARLVEDYQCGLTYSDRDSLRFTLIAIRAHQDGFSDQAIQTYRDNFTEEKWVEQITKIYRGILR